MLEPEVAASLAACVAPEAVLRGAEDLARFADPAGNLPDLALLPASAAEAAAVLRLANRERLSLVSRGAGTSAPRRVGVAVVLVSERLNRVIEVDAANLTATVEPGVRLDDLQRAAARLGLFLPPDPPNVASATVGGATAVDARGPLALKYGSMRDYVLRLEAVLADGTELHTGANTVKSASGYNLTHLFVGSHGTLCFYTRLTLRLLPQPEERTTLAFAFAELAQAAGAAERLFTSGILPARLNVLDRRAGQELSAGCPLDALGSADALLLCELDGSAAGVSRQIEVVDRVVETSGSHGRKALEPAEGEAVWTRMRGLRADPIDGSPLARELLAPRGHQARLLRYLAALPVQQRAGVGIIADPGVGSLRFIASDEPRDESDVARLAAFRQTIDAAAAGLTGGDSPGPGPVAVAVVQALRAAFDPCGILSAGETGAPERQTDHTARRETSPVWGSSR
jgi:glycolate oxidase